MTLRGKRLRKYKTSILAMTQTNIHSGRVMLEYFPNLCVDLTCGKTLKASRLDVYIHGDEFTDLKNFSIMHKVYFRLESLILNTRFLSPLSTSTNESVILNIDSGNFIVFTAKDLKWEEITLPYEIELKDAQPP